MGMSASQMRYCMLTGRKTDVEFQGQQINQQRTTLATQTSSYNNKLMDLQVPTPPSTENFTTTAYTFSSNGQERTVTGAVYNSTSNAATGAVAGTYTVNYTTNETTAKGESTGSSIFTNAGTSGAPQYQVNGNNLTLTVITSGAPGYSAEDASNIALITKDCGIKDATNRSYGDPAYVTPAFYKYTSDGDTKYVLGADLATNANTTTAISTYDVNNNATVTTNSKMTGATVNWSNSGRMSSITDKDGHEYSLNVSTTNDDKAYEDAYNEYVYKKSVYDQEISGINAQVNVIQSQDKKLELKLQDLDTQQKALSTEMDSVKKVIDKNIETSFKTFA